MILWVQKMNNIRNKTAEIVNDKFNIRLILLVDSIEK